MKRNNLPVAKIGTRPGVRTEVSIAALDRWNSDIRSATDDEEKENTISILDIIGADFFGDGVTSKRIAGALRSIGEKPVTVEINSPGGNYFEGLAIYNMLREHKGEVNVKILGIAASAASIIAMAGDTVSIARAGFLMIHNTWVFAIGDRHELREVADWLEPFDEAATDIYSARTGIDRKDVAAMLDKETWIGGSKAVEDGFADSLLSSDQVEVVEQSADSMAVSALQKLDAYMAKAGVSKSERREIVADLKGGMSGAAPTGMSGAAVVEGIEGLLQFSRSI